MRRFREFVKSESRPFRLREEETAPTPDAGAPPNPDSGGTTNKYHYQKMQDELDIDDESMKGAMEGGVHTLYKIPDYGWGFRVKPPIQAVVKKFGEQCEVTFLLNQANKRKMMLPYKEGERPTYYEGPVEDKTVTMTQEELADLEVPPYEMVKQGMGAPPGGGMGGPMPGGGGPMAGGMPPMAGGAAPMPPMGGM